VFYFKKQFLGVFPLDSSVSCILLSISSIKVVFWELQLSLKKRNPQIIVLEQSKEPGNSFLKPSLTDYLAVLHGV